MEGGGTGFVQKGRKPLLDIAGIEKFRNVVHTSTLALDSLTDGIYGQNSYKRKFDDLVNEENGTSSLGKIITDPKTAKKYRQEIGAVVVNKADKKTIARTKAYLNMRNPLLLCATLGVLKNSVQLHPDLYLSSDDVSVLLNDGEKPRCIATKEAQMILDKHNLGVSVTVEEMKRRVVTFNVTINADSVVCTVVKIVDHRFKFLDKPLVLHMENNLYVMLYPHGFNDTQVN